MFHGAGHAGPIGHALHPIRFSHAVHLHGRQFGRVERRNHRRPAEAGQGLPVAVHVGHVVEDERGFDVGLLVTRILDNESAKQPESELRGHVAVIPAEARRIRRELVEERPPVENRLLRDVRHAVHVVRQEHAVPVHRAVRAGMVDVEPPESLAVADAKHGARQLSVVGEPGERHARSGRESERLRGERHIDGVAIGGASRKRV